MSYFGNPLHTPVVQWAHRFLLLRHLLQLNRFNMFIKRHKNLMNDDVYVLLNQTQSFLYALAGRNQSSTTALSSHAGGKFEVMPRHHHQIDDAATCSAVVNNAKSIHLCVCVRGALMGHRTPSFSPPDRTLRKNGCPRAHSSFGANGPTGMEPTNQRMDGQQAAVHQQWSPLRASHPKARR